MDNNDDTPDDADRPWLRYFNEYINNVEQVPEGWSMLKWWGVRFCYFIFRLLSYILMHALYYTG